MSSTIRIGCWSGFWGDSSLNARQLVEDGDIDYLVGDYLAEVTMGILARLKQGSEGKGGMGEGGYVKEFVYDVFVPLMSLIKEKGIKIVTNAGGMNPVALKEAIEKVSQEAGFSFKVAAVEGDDLMDIFHSSDMQDGLKLFDVEGEVEALPTDKMMISCNAYIGAFPVAQALDNGAEIVVTGRSVDSAFVLGPLIHEFGWGYDDYDLLACGSVAGHILECGCHATGGNFTDWELSEVNGWDNVGCPIAICSPDGTFTVTKPSNTGGLVSVGTISEQILYEIHDPENYILADVVVDFKNVVLTQTAKDQVLVQGVKGKPPTEFYKTSATYFGGLKMDGSLMIGGENAVQKAHAVAKAILSRTRKEFKRRGWDDYSAVNVEVLGSEQLYGPTSRKNNSREVILRICVKHQNKKALSLLSKEIAPSALSMSPGITGAGSGRPKFTPEVIYHSLLVPKRLVNIVVHVGSDSINYINPVVTVSETLNPNTASCSRPQHIDLSDLAEVPLIAIAHGRSGDKGDVVNIGIRARSEELYPYLLEFLTEDKVKDYMGHLLLGKVKRYTLPGIHAVNFVCTKALGGGGMSSMNMDRQGKCYAQVLLSTEIKAKHSLLVSLPKL